MIKFGEQQSYPLIYRGVEGDKKINMGNLFIKPVFIPIKKDDSELDAQQSEKLIKLH